MKSSRYDEVAANLEAVNLETVKQVLGEHGTYENLTNYVLVPLSNAASVVRAAWAWRDAKSTVEAEKAAKAAETKAQEGNAASESATTTIMKTLGLKVWSSLTSTASENTATALPPAETLEKKVDEKEATESRRFTK